MSGGGFRVSIPNSVRKTIQDIKEITGNHSEEEIYAMLKECNMDPNETAQKLLLQGFNSTTINCGHFWGPENLNNRESAESRWRPGMQGRGGRGGRVNFSPRYLSHDAGGGRSTAPGTENGPSQVAEKGGAPSLPTSRETKNKERSLVTSSVPVIVDGSTNLVSGSTSVVHPSHVSVGSGPDITCTKLRSGLVLPTPASTLAVCFSSSDPVLVPSNDSRLLGSVGTIKREVGSHHPSASEIGSSQAQGKVASKTQGVGKSQLADLSHPSSTSTHGSSGSRPSSNYSSRSQQSVGTQKVGTNKEWKPKPVNSTVVQGQGTTGTAVASEVPADSSVSSVLDSEEATSKLQRKLEELHLPQRKTVILPNHIHVPESERTKLSFGSFGATFGVSTGYVSGPETDKSSTPRSETSQVIEEAVEEQLSSNQNALATANEDDYPDHPQSPTHAPENISSGEGDVSSSATQGQNESKHDTALPSGGHQFSVAHTSPNYSFGFVPPILGSQLAPFENSESQPRDISRLPSFVVQPPFDPASYYAQFYRSGADSDGRLSPFPSPGVSSKYNGNVAVLPPSSQSPQEGGVLSAAGPTPLVTQAAGLVQSSIGVTQQQVPVFRPPAGMHISHYAPNYIPYSHYFSPFYVPPPAIHQFLGNGAFPQQPQAGGVYPAPPAAAATGVKYSLPQYKTGTNTGNSAHIGMASGYGPYGSSPAGYNPSSATTAGNSTANEDLSTSQFKESNVYMTGQQSEGSSVWVAAPGREMSSLTSSFYNLPPQGQHVTFTPTQAGHGTFAGIYHPAQAVTAATVHPLLQQSQTMAGAVDMVGPGGSVYQQPQHAQINWPSNY
ncbi:GBF-interacting protein 1-like isoform X2 [Prunus yedoensis var. nudiflora]|uniref:GBF-interacting protein 1-like isoform X2 n=1 Tax=Prunus yedoensis var. nudiflora TaxID=2094558 RepID=A0A314U7Z4_PRUYE|nr:GBF-interacting protein 1-like isoform X2 [Prunus yedoensis var. nudiflora]